MTCVAFKISSAPLANLTKVSCAFSLSIQTYAYYSMNIGAKAVGA
jgi:hypothetical protein